MGIYVFKINNDEAWTIGEFYWKFPKESFEAVVSEYETMGELYSWLRETDRDIFRELEKAFHKNKDSVPEVGKDRYLDFIKILFMKSDKEYCCGMLNHIAQKYHFTEKIQLDKVPEEKAAFCRNCGAKLPAGAKFCCNCGNKLDLLKDGAADSEVKRIKFSSGNFVHSEAEKSFRSDGDTFRSDLEVSLFDNVKLIMKPIPAGTFTMGSPSSEISRNINETQHKVTLSRPFWLGKYQLTQNEYLSVTGSNPSKFKNNGSCPVERISWFGARAFCDRLNTLTEGLRPAGYRYALPTEAQWERACRAGTETPFGYGNGLNSSMANFNGHFPYNSFEGNYEEETMPVGSFEPNSYGLYDMHGNLLEWCLDSYGDYAAGDVTDPCCGGGQDSLKVLRGGCWSDIAALCRSAYRNKLSPAGRSECVGMRVALSYTL